MASHFGGDLAATDAARVLRLPGFANRKLAQEFLVQVVQESDRVHSLRDFNLPEDAPEARRHLLDGRGFHRPAGHQSVNQASLSTRNGKSSPPSGGESQRIAYGKQKRTTFLLRSASGEMGGSEDRL